MFEENKVYHGFRFDHSEFVEEIESNGLVFEHLSTNAEVIFLSNSDDNKVFLISFTTPPQDDSGITHILEHSVLNGSEKYPLKEPFAELLKSSLYTFLNAMTYPDRTVYPVASRNSQDFTNLMDVYLDAVFNPLLSELTFYQEGWHYSLESPDKDLTYSGVVYNEMLGSYSDPENILIDALNKSLYPNSIYGLSAGGDPEYIPDLSYSNFKEYHQKYYHPSNSRVLIYGDVDVNQQLSHLEKYFGKFKRQETYPGIKPQPKFTSPKAAVSTYPVSLGENTDRKTYLLRSYLLDHPTNAEFMLAFTILARIIGGTSASPLRKVLIDSNLGESTLNYGFENDMLDTNYSIGLKGTNEDKLEEMESLIDQTLNKMAQEGIGERLIRASMNSIEFQLREANFGGYPKGLCYGLSMLNSWTYGADPFMHLRYEEPLKKIKEKAFSARFFEEMITKYFLGNKHVSSVTLRPDASMEERRLESLRKTLRNKKELLLGEQINEIILKNQNLKEFQLKPDSKEALATIPKLSIGCIDKTAEIFPFEIQSELSPQITFSNLPTNGIAYLTFAFDASAVPQDLLPYLPLFSHLTLQLGTGQKSFVDLIQEIDIHTGGIMGNYSTTSVKDDPDQIKSQLIYSCKVLKNNMGQLFSILSEIFTDCNYRDSKRIGELIRIAKSNLQSRIIPNGHSFAATRLASYYSRIGWYRELTGGLSQYHFLEEISLEYMKDPQDFIDKIEKISEILFNRETMGIHLTGSDDEQRIFNQEIKQILDSIPQTKFPVQKYSFPKTNFNEGFIIPSKIQYVGKGVNFYDLGYKYDGSYEVLETLLSREYLWNTVRVQGGAYGCFSNLDVLSGNFCCISYRDPNLLETVTIFDAITDYLRQLELTRDDLERLIIGTIGSIDSPKTPDQKGAVAYAKFISGVSDEDIQRKRTQILSCSSEDFKNYVELFEKFKTSGRICVVGSEEKIRHPKHLFSSIQTVFGG